MKSYLLSALTVGILAASVGQAQAISIVLDDFSTTSTNTSTRAYTGSDTSAKVNNPNNSNLSTSATTGTGILGTRNTSVKATAGVKTSKATLKTLGCSLGLGGGNCMTYSSDNGVKGLFSLKYDTFGTPQDLTGGGNNDVLRLGILTSDFSTNLRATVKSLGGGSAFIDTTTPMLLQGLTNLDLAFSSFVGVDFSKVTSVDFAFDAPSGGTDLQFKFFSAEDTTPVPEPLTILGTLVAGGIGVGMKRKKQQLQKEAC